MGNHYKKNHMRDWEEQLREVKMYYSFGAAATRDIALLKQKYEEIKTLVDQQEGKKPRIQVSIFDDIGGQDLLHQNSDEQQQPLRQMLRLKLEEVHTITEDEGNNQYGVDPRHSSLYGKHTSPRAGSQLNKAH